MRATWAGRHIGIIRIFRGIVKIQKDYEINENPQTFRLFRYFRLFRNPSSFHTENCAMLMLDWKRIGGIYMQSATQSAPGSKKMIWAGRVISALAVLMLLSSGTVKLLNLPDITKEFARLGYPEGRYFTIGILEIACAVLYAIPQTAVLGAILLTGYLGGAVATHVR